jgi:hypothetical protein
MSISELSFSRGAEPSPGELHDRGVLRDRLTAEFPDVAPERIGALIDQAYARTRGARVQLFRVLLAEREVRAALS